MVDWLWSQASDYQLVESLFCVIYLEPQGQSQLFLMVCFLHFSFYLKYKKVFKFLKRSLKLGRDNGGAHETYLSEQKWFLMVKRRLCICEYRYPSMS